MPLIIVGLKIVLTHTLNLLSNRYGAAGASDSFSIDFRTNILLCMHKCMYMKSLDLIFLKKCDKVYLRESVVFVEYQEH